MSEWFFFSFCDAERPTGQQFLGGCYVRVPDDAGLKALAELHVRERRGDLDAPVEEDTALPAAALAETHRLGINPGGEVQTLGPLSEEAMAEHVPPELRNRLLSREEVESH